MQPCPPSAQVSPSPARGGGVARVPHLAPPAQAWPPLGTGHAAFRSTAAPPLATGDTRSAGHPHAGHTGLESAHALRHAALLHQPHSLATLSRPAAGAQPAPAAGSCSGRPPGGVGCLLVAAHSCWQLMARRRCSNGGAWEGGHSVASTAAGCLMWGCHQAAAPHNSESTEH
jgi:hypothetical protein